MMKCEKVTRGCGLLVLGLLALALGCSSTHSLKRPADARKPAVEAGLSLSAYFEGERTDSERPTEFVPVFMTLQNLTPHAVRVHMTDISLVNERGTRFRPLPVVAGYGPYRTRAVSGDAIRHASWPRQSGTDKVYFRSQRQLMRTSAASTYVIYPNYGVWRKNQARAYIVDGERASSFPLQAVGRVTLAEQVVQSGGSASGYVYFSRQARQADRLSLTWDARSPSGDRLAMLSLDADVVPE